MRKRDKREERIQQNTTNVSLEDFEALVSKYGYIYAGAISSKDGDMKIVSNLGYVEGGAKHRIAVVGEGTVTYKPENPVKSVYVKQLLKFIDRMQK